MKEKGAFTAQKCTERRKNGVSRWFPPVDYLQNDYLKRQWDLQSAVEWNSSLRHQVNAHWFSHALSCNSDDGTCSNNSYEGAPTREQLFEALQEYDQYLKKNSNEYVAHLREQVREARE